MAHLFGDREVQAQSSSVFRGIVPGMEFLTPQLPGGNRFADCSLSQRRWARRSASYEASMLFGFRRVYVIAVSMDTWREFNGSHSGLVQNIS